ncbi:MAG: NAD-dependent epimerase/dehydratase family protein [Candidatus Microbacterium phytovorans]|uniref:NAD-dependent epimerase/dehydratase family protein n=1 Tax=Candidatus Microbacterium phytovorans TaxID=3121374 RepID=A0AAJ5W1C7_9MICO|nr:NAD-dependent epimerase/dehydratase family protein [Microbacterium sp.]WEK13795.1 MAG: NAD-dependent epimerase/dehydratase family protein [Microbacterium sp.]
MTSDSPTSSAYAEDLRVALDSIPGVRDLFGTRILVTGATGMICSSVVDLLLHMNREWNADITVYVAGRREQDARDRFSSFADDERFVFVPYDATSGDAVELGAELDYIIHGASNANPALYMERPVDTMLANIVGLSAMFDLGRATSARRVLYISSSEVYGQRQGTDAFREDDFGYLDILNRRAGYPSSKRAGESLCVAYGMQYGLESVIVRPGHIYGPSIRDADNRVSAEVTRRALAGEDVILKSAGSQLRSYCYSLDCASAILTVLLRGEPANAYNISNPHSICTVRELAEAVAHAGGVEVRFDLPAGSETVVHNLMDNSSLASDKLEALGWAPAFDLAHGVDRMMKVLRAAGGTLTV